jgi:hypothetical protein
MRKSSLFFILFFQFILISNLIASEKIPLVIEKNIPGAPQLLGIPFPKDKLNSSDHVKVLNSLGQEIPSQITIVNTWEPVSTSVKWIWVFFFSDNQAKYTLEFGADVVRKTFTGDRVIVENNQRDYGRVKVNTGPLQFTINSLGGGFLDKVELDLDRNGFDSNDLIAESNHSRGTFLNILDKSGIDTSRVKINHSVQEKGSGPLHAIIRIEGDYLYSKKDNNSSPFVMRIHAYAGKTYIKVLHTIIYTGDPDMHKKVEGEYASIATQNKSIVDEAALKNDPGWTVPNDQISSAGLQIKYNLSSDKKFKTGYFDGSWTNQGIQKTFEINDIKNDNISILQSGPNINRLPALNTTTPTKQTDGFESILKVNEKEVFKKDRVPGWVTITDKKWGIGVGVRNFFEEYPKEIAIQGDSNFLYTYIWSPNVTPMSFARASGLPDSEMLGNFAQGLGKTTEIIYQFFDANVPQNELLNRFQYFLDPPVSHTSPEWYAKSNVYGDFAIGSEKYPELERGITYKFEWMRFNQKWEPWYGMLDYGDFQTYYVKNKWNMWTNNEPANDFMWWFEFMRTGNRDYYITAQATSAHTMDVDNIHWPAPKIYYGQTNNSVDFFDNKEKGAIGASPYIGMGRRHASQHFTSLLSAHVWVQGWIASYLLTGNHRALDVAEETGDLYLRRIWGDHDLRGRRLYLSVWNLSEIYDVNKKEKYFKELKDRVDIVLDLQKSSDQGGSLVLDRYGYAQNYISHGLYKFYQMTNDEKVKRALITHAIWQRDNPSINHQMESYLSTIHGLTLGYEFTKDQSFLNEAIKRAQYLITDKLPIDISQFKNQKDFSDALEKVSHLPDDKESFRKEAIWKITNGLRIFGWTHMFGVPYLKSKLEKTNLPIKNK